MPTGPLLPSMVLLHKLSRKDYSSKYFSPICQKFVRIYCCKKKIFYCFLVENGHICTQIDFAYGADSASQCGKILLDIFGLFPWEICCTPPFKVNVWMDSLNMSTMGYGNACTANWSLTGVTEYTCGKDSL